MRWSCRARASRPVSRSSASSATKLARQRPRRPAKCRDADIDGTRLGACPNAGNLAKIGRIGEKLVDAAAANCKSVCAVSQDIECVARRSVPAAARTGSNESCSAGAQNLPFDMRNIGFPGPLLRSGARRAHPRRRRHRRVRAARRRASVGRPDRRDLRQPHQRELRSRLRRRTASPSISKAAQKLASTTAKGVAQVPRRDQLRESRRRPEELRDGRRQSRRRRSRRRAKVRDTVTDNCSSATAPSSISAASAWAASRPRRDAQDCLVALGREVADSGEVPVERLFAPVSIIDAAYPPRAGLRRQRRQPAPESVPAPRRGVRRQRRRARAPASACRPATSSSAPAATGRACSAFSTEALAPTPTPAGPATRTTS